ncbi:cation efflux family-domain-containing protein, partial [Chytriomyces sp. MP71]
MSTLLNIGSDAKAMLPMHVSHSTSSDKYRRGSLQALVVRYVRTIISDPKTRNVFFFLILNITFTVVEFLYGWWTNSLGLLSDAVHMLFDSTALILSLWASVIVKWQATDTFSYGFGRVETLTGFGNALALVFASLGIIWEAIERMFDPPKLAELNSLLIVSILGFIVNLVGIFAFDHGGMGHDHGHGGHGHSHGGHGGHGGEHPAHEEHGGHDGHSHGGHSHAPHSHGSHSHGGDSHGHNPLLHGMFLHVLSDTLGSVGVIISTLCIQWFGWTWTDPLISLIIAILTLVSIWPLLKGCSFTLLQRTPTSVDGRLVECYRKVNPKLCFIQTRLS